MKALLHPEELNSIPATARWLKYSLPALRRLDREFSPPYSAEAVKRLSELNVIEQIKHLHTHPSVEAAVRRGSLALHGWYYEIHTGRVEVYEPESGRFEEWD